MNQYRDRLLWRLAVVLSVFILVTPILITPSVAQSDNTLSGQALVEALRKGGYNIYFRHAATDWSQFDHVAVSGDWTSCDPAKIRQLSEEGRATARAIGAAIRSLDIPIGQILASPYCRTVETASLMLQQPVETTTDIMNTRVAEYFGGSAAIAERTRQRLSAPPLAGTNTVLVAHGNILRTATSVYPDEAEAIIFRPGGDAAYSVVGRITPQEWARLAAE